MPHMNSLSPKVAAATGGTGLGPIVVIVLLWICHASPPPEVIAALSGLASGICAFGAGWITPHPEGQA